MPLSWKKSSINDYLPRYWPLVAAIRSAVGSVTLLWLVVRVLAILVSLFSPYGRLERSRCSLAKGLGRGWLFRSAIIVSRLSILVLKIPDNL